MINLYRRDKTRYSILEVGNSREEASKSVFPRGITGEELEKGGECYYERLRARVARELVEDRLEVVIRSTFSIVLSDA